MAGRPLSSAWVDTDAAVEQLGLSARQLRKLREQLKPGFHYRVKNPKALRPRYLWHVERIEPVLVPDENYPVH